MCKSSTNTDLAVHITHDSDHAVIFNPTNEPQVSHHNFNQYVHTHIHTNKRSGCIGIQVLKTKCLKPKTHQDDWHQYSFSKIFRLNINPFKNYFKNITVKYILKSKRNILFENFLNMRIFNFTYFKINNSIK